MKLIQTLCILLCLPAALSMFVGTNDPASSNPQTGGTSVNENIPAQPYTQPTATQPNAANDPNQANQGNSMQPNSAQPQNNYQMTQYQQQQQYNPYQQFKATLGYDNNPYGQYNPPYYQPSYQSPYQLPYQSHYQSPYQYNPWATPSSMQSPYRPPYNPYNQPRMPMNPAQWMLIEQNDLMANIYGLQRWGIPLNMMDINPETMILGDILGQGQGRSNMGQFNAGTYGRNQQPNLGYFALLSQF